MPENSSSYIRKAQYHETDQMGIIHHANYVRWFEEARIALMDQAGFTYQRMEEEGIYSPVVAVSCEYKSMVRFGDTVCIDAHITAFTGVKMTVAYKITDHTTGELRTIGSSKHCFINKANELVNLKKENPPLYALFQNLSKDGI